MSTTIPSTTDSTDPDALRAIDPMSAPQCGEGDGPAIATLRVENLNGDVTLDVYHVCRRHLADVLVPMLEDGDHVEVMAVAR